MSGLTRHSCVCLTLQLGGWCVVRFEYFKMEEKDAKMLQKALEAVSWLQWNANILGNMQAVVPSGIIFEGGDRGPSRGATGVRGTIKPKIFNTYHLIMRCPFGWFP